MFFKIVIPALNIICAMLSLWGLVAQVVRRRRVSKHTNFQNVNRSLMNTSLLAAFGGSVLRTAYCLMGPFFSGSYLTYRQTVFLGTPGVALTSQIISIAATVCLFERLGSLSKQSIQRRDISIFIGTCGVIVATCLRDFFAAQRSNAIGLAVNHLVSALFVFVTAVFFLLQGFSTIKILMKEPTSTIPINRTFGPEDSASRLQTSFKTNSQPEIVTTSWIVRLSHLFPCFCTPQMLSKRGAKLEITMLILISSFFMLA
jgi:multisubunit Na+/H+ antiporter MnhB subunit